jgi:hypothetical protein
MFESFDLFSGPARPTKPRSIPRHLPLVIQLLGALMAALAVFFPVYLAPLVWGSVTFLLDPWNYRKGARSLLADLAIGKGRTIVRLLAAGLFCGLLWESFNYFSPQKWIYTVRGLEEAKVFEMPLLGFLGFPALALDAFSFFAFVSYWLHGNRTWENPADVRTALAPRKGLTSRSFAFTLPLHFALWGAVAFSTQFVNIGSVALELSDLKTLPPDALSTLPARGIERPGQLLRAIGEGTLDWKERELAEVETELRLLMLKGIGRDHGELLLRAGIASTSDLARAEPDSLYRALQSWRRSRFPALRIEMVRVWIDAARDEDSR